MRCGPIPLTAPYPIAATWRNGVVVLSGRVGTKVIHDAAVQLAIAVGFPFRDDLVIDTAETFRVAMSSTPSMTGYAALTPNLSASYYVYPQPLFGRLDDPFFGMVPPLVSFAPVVAPTDGRPHARSRTVSGQPAPNPMPGPNGVGQPAPNPGVAPGPAAWLPRRRTSPLAASAIRRTPPRAKGTPSTRLPPRVTSRSRSTPPVRSSCAASSPARRSRARSSKRRGASRESPGS